MPSARPELFIEDLRRHVRTDVFGGIDRSREDRVGLEVEFFPLIRSLLGTPDAQPRREGSGLFMGLYPWLLLVAERLGWEVAQVNSTAALAFDLDNGGRVTLEPGGQIEYSAPPFRSVHAALDDVELFERALTREGERVGLVFATEGFNRWVGSTLPQLVVEKPRYLAMDRHFESIGPFGRLMMRQTCATQINVDFGSSSTAEERWRVANLAAPALNALFANSPHRLNGVRHRSFRHEIWRRTDPVRTGAIPGIRNTDPISAWLNFALDASVMIMPASQDRFVNPSRQFSFREWLEEGAEGSYPDLDDWELHLTTLFPDVRPRGFLELRSVDALPAVWRRAAVILATELLYNDDLLEKSSQLLHEEAENVTRIDDPEQEWQRRFTVGCRLLTCAVRVTGDESLAAYSRRFAEQGRTPADLGLAERSSILVLAGDD